MIQKILKYRLYLSVKFFLVFFVLLGILCVFLLMILNRTIKPTVRTATEIALISSAQMMASIAAIDLQENNIQNGQLDFFLKQVKKQSVNASVYQNKIMGFNQNVYITDQKGIVIYDSEQKNLGADFSKWRDVYLTLRGQYGARSTHSDPNNDRTSVMHVAMPIYDQKNIVGVLTVSQANQFLDPIIFKLERDVLHSGGILIVICFILGLILVIWISRSIKRLTDYAKNITLDKNTPLPRISAPELVLLANALVEMREKLDHKSYIEHYIHTLTHELKSPISAIFGATEILKTNPPLKHRLLFLENIAVQSERMQSVIERLLMLAQLDVVFKADYQSVDCSQLIQEIIGSMSVKAQSLNVHIRWIEVNKFNIQVDVFWFKQMIINLIDNAIDFSPKDGIIEIQALQTKSGVCLTIKDQGSGIPDFAQTRIFERFYSLPRQDGYKSSGIGLTLVKEVVLLHKGSISINNRSDMSSDTSSDTKGTIVVVELPYHYPQ